MITEKGFILPTTISLVLFCLLIIANISAALINEKKFYSETEQYYLLENMKHLAVDQANDDIENGTAVLGIPISEITLLGSFTYTVFKLTNEVYEVEIACETVKNKVYTAKYQYQLTKSEIILWSEY